MNLTIEEKLRRFAIVEQCGAAVDIPAELKKTILLSFGTYRREIRTLKNDTAAAESEVFIHCVFRLAQTWSGLYAGWKNTKDLSSPMFLACREICRRVLEQHWNDKVWECVDMEKCEAMSDLFLNSKQLQRMISHI